MVAYSLYTTTVRTLFVPM